MFNGCIYKSTLNNFGGHGRTARAGPWKAVASTSGSIQPLQFYFLSIALKHIVTFISYFYFF